MQDRIVELLAKLSDGKLTEQLLIVNDDLNNLFLRLDYKILPNIMNLNFLQLYNLYNRYSRYEKNREAGCSNITVDGSSIKTTDLLQGFIDEPIATTSNQFSKLSNYTKILYNKTLKGL